MTKHSKLKHCSFCNKSSLEVKQLVAGPNCGADTVYICNECVHIAHRATSGQLRVLSEHTVPEPRAIAEYLDRHVVGQDHAKQVLSVAAVNHLKRAHIDPARCHIDKSNVLLIGPSGCGKTLLVRHLANQLDVPFVHVDATVFTETGYVGEDADSIAEMLLEQADGDVVRAQQGIVLIDEIDKRSRRSSQTSTSKDVSGEGVQQALLKLIEGKQVRVKSSTGGETVVDTSQVLFIAAGAFVDLQQHKQRRNIGFAHSADADKSVDIVPEDLVQYGLIPEFVGRFPVIAELEQLTSEQLVQVLTEPEHSLTEQYRALFEIDHIQLEFAPQYLNNLAQRALVRNTGARALRSMLEQDLMPTQFQLPQLKQQGIVRVEMHADAHAQYHQQKAKHENNQTQRNHRHTH